MDLQKKIHDLNVDLAGLPLTVSQDIAEEVSKWDPTGITRSIVHKMQDVVNPALDNVKGQIKGANDALANIQNHQIKASNDALTQAVNELSALDDKLQAVQKDLASGVLQKSFALAKAHLELQGKLLGRSRDAVVELKRADLKLQNYIKTWTGKGTQDTQMPDITDADLELSRPAPEVAEAALKAAQAALKAAQAALPPPPRPPLFRPAKMRPSTRRIYFLT